jgi:hypothetical protein
MNQALYKKNLPETWTGTDIDGLAHEMWQLAISKEQFWNHISVEVGLWNHGKLRMLAMASVMPTWWFLREQAVTVMKAKGWNVDDSFYTMQMDQYYQLCRHQDRLRTAGK